MPSLSILLALLTFSPHALAEKKTSEQYWTESGMSVQMLNDQLNVLSVRNCMQSVVFYRGCVAALNAVAGMAEPPLQFVPTASASAFGGVVEELGDFSLVKLPAETKTEKPFSQYWAEAQAKKKGINEQIEKIYKKSFADRQAFLFENGLLRVQEIAVPEPAKDALVAATAFNAYFEEAEDAHGRLAVIAKERDQMIDADESFAGIGVTIQPLSGKIVVVSPIEGSPSEKAGVIANDVIKAVNGVSVEGKKLDEVVAMIRGKACVGAPQPDCTVKLDIVRKAKPLTITVARGNIVVENVEGKIVKNFGTPVGWIKLRSFSDEKLCGPKGMKVKAKIDELTAAGAQGLILDMRGNPGGLLDQAVCIGGLFVGREVIVKVKDLQRDIFEDNVSEQDQVTKLPLAVLIDGGSASASEVVSGALQDHQRGWIVGDRSFGKATVQRTMNVRVNPNLWLFATIERFYQPNGTTNQVVGIQPDIAVPVRPDATADELFRLREGEIYPNHLDAAGPKWVQQRPQDVARISRCVKSGSLAQKAYAKAKASEEPVDYQLLAAQEVLGCAK